jgi:hypothetical protein
LLITESCHSSPTKRMQLAAGSARRRCATSKADDPDSTAPSAGRQKRARARALQREHWVCVCARAGACELAAAGEGLTIVPVPLHVHVDAREDDLPLLRIEEALALGLQPPVGLRWSLGRRQAGRKRRRWRLGRTAEAAVRALAVCAVRGCVVWIAPSRACLDRWGASGGGVLRACGNARRRARRRDDQWEHVGGEGKRQQRARNHANVEGSAIAESGGARGRPRRK